MYGNLCEICFEKPAYYRCPLCGRYVCEEHFNRRLNRCYICIESGCNVCYRNLAIAECQLCGRRICHKCSIELDEVRRICYLCIIGSIKIRNTIWKTGRKINKLLHETIKYQGVYL
ncbi:hypothetical protein Igag_1207 [Ignisphaera aggregans DSM 17230]|uniref:Uncharacterized protein n=1 Tax=Ignisphaera aggregans (strain DSM 17230 / JCM 13409 / AQ1.S1) TaxID=583356 RepID=E0SP86_IGNAA|nr:hypothetical protein Igag_1207 [Ignisphaera aggregans DSM 17230]